MSKQSSIRVSVADTRERKRRQREVWMGFGGVALVVGLAWIELRFLGLNSYLFLVLFNLNFVLLLIFVIIVARNMVKLLLERRRKVLGSKLRTRLVLAFMSLSLFPTVLLFLVSAKFVQTSVDYWFTSHVETSMEQALEVGQAFYVSARERLQRLGNSMISDIRGREMLWGGKAMDDYLAKKKDEYELSLVGVITPETHNRQNWHADQAWEQIWPEVAAKVDYAGLREDPDYWSTMLPAVGADYVVGVLPVDDAATGYLVVGFNLGQGLLFKLDQIVRGVDEYKKLKTLKYPLKVALYLTLGVMTLVIILGAIWFGFRLAKELSAPVQALAIGTQRIARGDLSVRLEDQSSDELGVLVQSFNRMAEDLQRSQERLTSANIRQRQINRELDARGKYMEAVLNNITAGVISLDSQGRISTVNQAAELMLGLDSEKVLGRRPLDLLQGEYAHIVKDIFSQLEKSPGAGWQRQLTITQRNRERRFLVNAVVLRHADGREAGLVSVFEDITELEKMQRLAAWREVARRIAHEIKNPLTPIKLSAQRLERKFASDIEDQSFRECIDLIVRQVEHMKQMVQEFSAYAKIPEVMPRRSFLAPLVEEVVGVFANSHRHIDWELTFSGPIPESRFDPEGMHRVLMNLLTNAAEALEANQELQDGPDGEPVSGSIRVHVEHDAANRLLRVKVADNGPGLSAEESSRVFEPYFSRKKGGTGLGLAIVKSIVDDHHGQVHVQANTPRGMIFVVEIPAT